jgi:preprotein translocase subunit SecG
MYTAILTAHLMLAIMIIVVVLLQRSEGSGLTPSDAQTFGNRRTAAHPLSRLTAILAALFMVTSLSLTLMGQRSAKPTSILDNLPASESSAVPNAPVSVPAGQPAAPANAAKPDAPAQPTVPVTK